MDRWCVQLLGLVSSVFGAWKGGEVALAPQDCPDREVSYDEPDADEGHTNMPGCKVRAEKVELCLGLGIQDNGDNAGRHAGECQDTEDDDDESV